MFKAIEDKLLRFGIRDCFGELLCFGRAKCGVSNAQPGRKQATNSQGQKRLGHCLHEVNLEKNIWFWIKKTMGTTGFGYTNCPFPSRVAFVDPHQYMM